MKTLIVTAIGSFSASAVIRGCREAGFRVVGTEIHDAADIAESRDVDRFVKVPRFDAGESYLKALQQIAREESAAGILPLTDAELDLLNEHRDLFRPASLWVSPKESIKRSRSKETSREAAAKAFAGLAGNGGTEAGGTAAGGTGADGTGAGGTATDETAAGETAAGAAGAGTATAAAFSVIPTKRLADCSEEGLRGGLPLILKIVDGRSSEGLFRVRTGRELDAALSEIRAAGAAASYLVQPLLSGPVVCVDTVRDGSGNTLSVPREEHRRTWNGAGISVRVFRDKALEAACAALSSELGILGCVNYEFIRTEDGTYHFLECNPRFSGGTAFSAAAGLDMVKLHLDVFAGRNLPAENTAHPCSVSRKYIEVVTQEC